MKFIYTALICIFAAAGAYAQGERPAKTSGVEDIYLAKDNGEGKAGDEATEFSTTDIPIYCVVMLDSAAKTTVKMNFVAVSVSGVRPDTNVVTTSYTTKEGQNQVYFTGRPEGKWTPGKYRVDLFLDNKPAKTLEFTIKGPAGDTTALKFTSKPDKPKPRKPLKTQDK